MSLIISSSIKAYPQLPYADIQNTILGKSYTLSLTFVGAKRAYTLNHTHRNATYIPNVLSFPLSEKVGEIYITPNVAYKEAHTFNLTPHGYIGFLFIHGLLHLKGYAHGDTMDKAERKYMQKFHLI